MANCGKFSRLCVEMDVSKPLISKFVVRGKLQKVEYERIGINCFCYGCIGHTENLYEKIKKDANTNKDDVALDFAQGSEVKKVVAKKRKFRPRMIAKKRKGVNKSSDNGKEKSNFRFGKGNNNFHILDDFSQKGSY